MCVSDRIFSEDSALVFQHHLVVNADLNYDFLTVVTVISFPGTPESSGIFSANISKPYCKSSFSPHPLHQTAKITRICDWTRP